jgi:hypothetical protein
MMFALLPMLLAGLIFPLGLRAWSEELMQPMTIAAVTAVSLSYIGLRKRVIGG